MAVQVVGDRHAGRPALARLLARIRHLLQQHGVRTPAVASLLAPVTIRSEFYGGEYALATPAVHAAMAHFESATDARRDSAYSGKALASSEDSRVGKECVSQCSSRWLRGHKKKKN